MTTFTPLSILSWNVRGLNRSDKREAILLQVRQSKADVVFLQEIHASDNHTRFPSSWLGPTFASLYEAFLTYHCAIFVRKSLFARADIIYSDDRLLHLKVETFHDIPAEFPNEGVKTIHLVCVYANVAVADRYDMFQDWERWASIPQAPWWDRVGDEATHVRPTPNEDPSWSSLSWQGISMTFRPWRMDRPPTRSHSIAIVAGVAPSNLSSRRKG